MYLGRIVELADAETLYTDPRHPYTRSLFSSIPVADPSRRRESAPIEGDPPSPVDIPTGCRFRTRCSFATEVCEREDPALAPVSDALPNGAAPHLAACHFARTLPVWNPIK
jgi:oligopeptide/dipeptide ABC transporter ATP-binding protein